MKAFWGLIYAALPYFGAAQFTIHLSTNPKLFASNIAVLSYEYDDRYIDDTVTLDPSGQATFQGKVSNASNAYLTLYHGNPDDDIVAGYFEILIIPTHLSYQISNQRSIHCSNNASVERFLQLTTHLQIKNDSLNKELYSHWSEKTQDSLKFEKRRIKNEKKIDSIRFTLVSDFLEHNRCDSVALLALPLINNSAYLTDAAISRWRDQLCDYVRRKPMSEQLFEKLTKKRPGFFALDSLASQVDTNLAKFDPKALKGNYLLLDFWASWCVPCRARNRELAALRLDLLYPKLRIVGIALEQKGQLDGWKNAIVKDSSYWIHLTDFHFWNNRVASAFGVNSVPANFLLDPDGRIIAGNLSAEQLQKLLAEIFPLKK